MVRILLVLSQRPEATGSGIYVRALLEEARRRGHEAFLVAGVPVGWEIPSLPVPRDRCRFVTFGARGDLPFPIPGMSDVMPYASTRFRDLTENQIDAYEEAFSIVCRDVVSRFEPQVIHAQHLWLVTSRLCKDIPELPLLASCHGSDLRQFLQLSHLRARVRAGCSRLDAVAALTTEQAEEIATLFEIPRGRIAVTGAGFDPRLFSPGKTRCGTVRIVYAGKLSRAKGVPWMLRALFRLRDLHWELPLSAVEVPRRRNAGLLRIPWEIASFCTVLFPRRHWRLFFGQARFLSFRLSSKGFRSFCSRPLPRDAAPSRRIFPGYGMLRLQWAMMLSPWLLFRCERALTNFRPRGRCFSSMPWRTLWRRCCAVASSGTFRLPKRWRGAWRGVHGRTFFPE